MRPSTYNLSPFFTYFSTMSASCELFVFHTTHRCHSVFSCLAPDASFHERLVASEKVATRLPPVVERTSGSFPRFPISVTLFKLRLTNSSWREFWDLAAHDVIQPMWPYNRLRAPRILLRRGAQTTASAPLPRQRSG